MGDRRASLTLDVRVQLRRKATRMIVCKYEGDGRLECMDLETPNITEVEVV